MSEIIRDRLNEVCPVERIENMTDDDILRAVNVAFEIIGYNPINLEEAMEYINNTSNAGMLSEYIYEVWEADQ